jgi:nitroreductase / dihydropteridine reductase
MNTHTENKKENMREEIIKALNWRYAGKIFDPNKKVSDENLKTILESARLSPGSSGLEMWKFLVIQNPEIRARIREVGDDQPKITDASHLIVIAHRTDPENISRERLERTSKIQNQPIEELGGLKKSAENAVNKHVANGTFECWAKAQTYIPLGIMIETAALLGVDHGPMEGFQPDKVDEILGLKEKNLKSVTMLALGYRGEDPAAKRPKIRRSFDDVIEFI